MLSFSTRVIRLACARRTFVPAHTKSGSLEDLSDDVVGVLCPQPTCPSTNILQTERMSIELP